VVLGDQVDPVLNRRVVQLARAIEGTGLAGVREVVPAYAAVTVFCDPLADAEAIGRELERLASGRLSEGPPASEPNPRVLSIPTRYDGPDLELVAERTGLTPEEVIRRHAGREYTVYLLGFAPGFAYLGELDPALRLPRRESPRLRVPAGSVAIAGAQTAVYPLSTPGGWHLLGSTDLVLFYRSRTPPALLRPGDRVRFEPLA
jgi:KipI family sensor histidine kinase inhibitor